MKQTEAAYHLPHKIDMQIIFRKKPFVSMFVIGAFHQEQFALFEGPHRLQ